MSIILLCTIKCVCCAYNGFVSISIAYVSNVENQVVFVHLINQVLGRVYRRLLQLQNLTAVVKFTMT